MKNLFYSSLRLLYRQMNAQETAAEKNCKLELKINKIKERTEAAKKEAIAKKKADA
jgi:hypothetical protein